MSEKQPYISEVILRTNEENIDKSSIARTFDKGAHLIIIYITIYQDHPTVN